MGAGWGSLLGKWRGYKGNAGNLQGELQANEESGRVGIKERGRKKQIRCKEVQKKRGTVAFSAELSKKRNRLNFKPVPFAESS